jgi:hypothetical protein
MNVGGEIKHTEIIQNNPNPLFDMTTIYSFTISPEQAVGGYVEFTVLDKGLLDFATIATSRVPFSALKAQMDNNRPTPIVLPLVNTRPDLRAIGKGFLKSKAKHTVISTSGTTSSNTSLSKSNNASAAIALQQAMTDLENSDMSTLSIQISKIDTLQCWMLEELRVRDQQRESYLSLHPEEATKMENIWVSQGKTGIGDTPPAMI